MVLNCASCGASFGASRPNARFCGGTCGKGAQRAGPAVIGPAGVLDGDEVPLSGLERAVARELEQAGQFGSVGGQVAGQIALELAYRIGSGHESGAATAALVKELRATMAAALAGLAPAPDALDELRTRRDRKRSAERL